MLLLLLIKAFKVITSVVGELARRMSESLVLPFNCVTYAEELERELQSFEKMYASDFSEYKIDFSSLRLAAQNFTRIASEFHKRLNLIDKTK